MKIAVQIPIKSRSSTRVPNKNFRDISGKPMFAWAIDELLKIDEFDVDIYIDSEGERAFDLISQHYGKQEALKYHKRNPWLAEDHANGNHLLNHFSVLNPDYDVYVQLFITAVTLRGDVVREAMAKFLRSLDENDSMFLVTEECGWVWYQGEAVNYDPTRLNGLPRSQDAQYFKETTGLYAITKDALFRTGCRIGTNPMLYEVDRFSSVDIDTMEDFAEAEAILHSESQKQSSIE